MFLHDLLLRSELEKIFQSVESISPQTSVYTVQGHSFEGLSPRTSFRKTSPQFQILN